ncbi:MAG TPA: hypothetical protein VGM50_22885 [Gemmatimonadaceae bacterium]|jgi:hypothetical protein
MPRSNETQAASSDARRWKETAAQVTCFPDCIKNGCTASRCRLDDDENDPLDWRDVINTDL